MTAICGMALGKKPIPDPEAQEFSTANFLLPSGQDVGPPAPQKTSSGLPAGDKNKILKNDVVDSASCNELFSKKTRAIIWGMQNRAVQSMLDFDFVCRRTEPSVAAIVYPFVGDHKQKFYWGHKEVKKYINFSPFLLFFFNDYVGNNRKYEKIIFLFFFFY